MSNQHEITKEIPLLDEKGNLTDNEMVKKYSPQICSRIDGEFVKLPFMGQDIRKILKEI